MGENELLIYIHQYGYVALFFCLWLGIVGMPIPDEMIVATGGFVSSMGMLKLVPAFMITYLGVVSGLSLGFVLGRILGKKVVDRVMKRKAKYYIKAEEITQKYGNIALIVSYFIPVVRHIVPYIVGMNKMTFKRYSIYSYSTALVWTMIYFILGFTFGDHSETIVQLGTKYGLVFGVIAVLSVFLIYRCHPQVSSYREK
ncbi:DedA family protein [Bacillus sp. DNRA2]|uniref:DedA family protein n=1 Tax=Bacillus sp. DNRA2 TaxID=2723053 RepID=UPI00145E0D67|nr:DedA family protein [Bacillus sp. DNRA2]NMD70009.1 DedA family protein [Bacillus sp. DNRA2]